MYTNKPSLGLIERQAKHKRLFRAMDEERSYWFSHWRTISDYFLPRRYPWLMSQKEVRTASRRNNKLLDSTSTLALRTLASGMMNGITSPARPWFNLRIPGFDEAAMSPASKEWLEETRRRMMLIMAESNFYNAMAVLYLEWCAFGTASMAIYEDFDSVFRCYNFSLGEFFLSQNDTLRINRHARQFTRTTEQVVEQFGLENCSDVIQEQYKRGDGSLLISHDIIHIIEDAQKDELTPNPAGKFREVYFEASCTTGNYLRVSPLYEWPTVTPRWELIGNDTYGTSPAMDALSDVIQLQKMMLRRAQGLDKQISPPMIVDQQLRNRPKALTSGGITYASTMGSNFGAKPAMQVNVPLQAIAYDIEQLKISIRETCHNQLFNMISQLDTVRSATEIDARREEKLVHLGPVLERFYDEGLDPALRRIYGIMDRAGLLPEAPEELADAEIEVQYVSILSDAQKASNTITIERFFQFVGGMTGVFPEAREMVDAEKLIREYGDAIGIKPGSIRPPEETAERMQNMQQAQALAQTAETGSNLAAGAKTLSETEVGGGLNALQSLIGG